MATDITDAGTRAAPLSCKKGVVSPTGFEGICHAAFHSWEIPFHGVVVAA
jgi:hypothetical protein